MQNQFRIRKTLPSETFELDYSTWQATSVLLASSTTTTTGTYKIADWRIYQQIDDSKFSKRPIPRYRLIVNDG